MTQDEAEAEATKLERHKAKHLSHKRWIAAHDSVKGWHIALVDNHLQIAEEAVKEAAQALQNGDINAYMKAANKAIMAKMRHDLEKER